MKKGYLLILIFCLFSDLFAQDGTNDLSFNPGRFDLGDGPDAIVRVIVIQPDGKIVIGGSFRSYSGTQMNGIARLNEDGSLDTSFNPNSSIMGGLLRLRFSQMAR